MNQDNAKIVAGQRVIEEYVEHGMTLGLGSGTTSHFFVRSLAEHILKGLHVTCTTTSKSTTDLAESLGIRIHDVNDVGQIDLTVDGPDEIDNSFRMIKGGGACLLWEKIVAHASTRMITICDETKIVDRLGAFPLPVEIVQFAWKQTAERIREICTEARQPVLSLERRMKGDAPTVTDSGNFILDVMLGAIKNPDKLEISLNMIPGVVENGLFTREANGMVVGYFDGRSEIRMRDKDGSATMSVSE